MLEEVAGIDHAREFLARNEVVVLGVALARSRLARGVGNRQADVGVARQAGVDDAGFPGAGRRCDDEQGAAHRTGDSGFWIRSEEHTSELQSLMRISYAVFCLKKKKK